MHDLFGRVLRQVQLVEASVAGGEPLDVVSDELDHSELLGASHAHQAFEAIHRHLGAAGHELKELRPLRVIERLQDLKQPHNLRRLARVVLVVSVRLQVIDVIVGETRDEEL